MRGYAFNDFADLVMLGPLSVMVSHGYDQLETLEKIMASTGDSTIQVLVSDWWSRVSSLPKMLPSALSVTESS